MRHHLSAGFKTVFALGSGEISIDPNLVGRIVRIEHDLSLEDAVPAAVNAVTAAANGQWIFYCFNGEYLFFPFCEKRTVCEMAAFSMEERRESILTYVIDLYAGDLSTSQNGVSLDDAYLDKSGYYALARTDKQNTFYDRQLDFYGGLKWRFEEHVPYLRRRIDRMSLFRAKSGLLLNGEYLLNDAEMNTYSCPWHHSLTAVVASFRTAKALKRNPGSSFAIDKFTWRNSVKFDWHSQQLMNLGLMEPGQWF